LTKLRSGPTWYHWLFNI